MSQRKFNLKAELFHTGQKWQVQTSFFFKKKKGIVEASQLVKKGLVDKAQEEEEAKKIL